MSATVELKLRASGVREILRSRQVRDELERRARRIAASAGPGHRVESEIGRNRARAAVITDTYDAMIAEARYRRLTSAMDAGRG